MDTTMDGRGREARRRALRAARAVTVTFLAAGLLAMGCAETIEGLTTGDASGADGAAVDARGDATADAGGDRCTNDGDAGSWQRYVACCDAAHWDFHRGCEAWGPVFPPEGAEEA